MHSRFEFYLETVYHSKLLALNRGKISSSPIAVGQDEDTETRVLIHKMAIEDGGHYTCIAKNSAGEVRHTIRVTVPGIATEHLCAFYDSFDGDHFSKFSLFCGYM